MIMENYKEELNNIHAPEDLILRTLQKVHEEEEIIQSEEKLQAAEINADEINTDTNKDNAGKDKISVFRKYNKFIRYGSTLVAAAVVLIIAINVSRMSKNTSTDFIPNEDSASDMPYDDTAEEYSASESIEMADEEAYEDEEFSKDETDFSPAAEMEDEESEDSIESAESSDNAVMETGEASGIYYNEIKSSLTYKNSETVNLEDRTFSNIREKSPDLKEISINDYSTLLGMDVAAMLDSFNIVSQKIYVQEDKDTSDLLEDYGIFVLNKDESEFTLTISKNKNVDSFKLSEGTPSYVNGKEVYFGKDSDNNKYMAAFNKDGVNMFVYSSDISQNAFEEVILNLNYK